jgi:molybdenum cofactor guanylyltransferase
MTGIVLAGGKSSRIGRDKSWLTYQGKPFIEIQVEKLKVFCTEILISTDNIETVIEGTEKVSDTFKGIGPMAGLYSCLKRSCNDRVFVLSVDTPLITTELMAFMIEQSTGYDITIAADSGGLHPLTGIYSKAVLEQMEHQISRGIYKITDLFQRCRFRVVETESFGISMMLNVNTFDDYERLNRS